MRFQRDIDSDWILKNKVPIFGVKESWDHLCGAMAFNIKRITLALKEATDSYCHIGELAPNPAFWNIPGSKTDC
jgi:hypothetical protein